MSPYLTHSWGIVPTLSKILEPMKTEYEALFKTTSSPSFDRYPSPTEPFKTIFYMMMKRRQGWGRSRALVPTDVLFGDSVSVAAQGY